MIQKSYKWLNNVVNAWNELGCDHFSDYDHYGQNDLHYWISDNLSIKDLIDTVHIDKLNLNQKDCFGRTPLLVAISKGQKENAQFLIEQGADVNLADDDGHSPLHRVCEKNWIDLATMLVKLNANVNSVDNHGDSVFFWTCLIGDSTGDDAMINLLLDHRVIVDQRSWKFLISYARIELLKLIINADVPIDEDVWEMLETSERCEFLALISPKIVISI